MLAKEHRLAKTKDVKRALMRGRSFFNPYFTINFFQRPLKASRFTVVVSTKVSKKAVRRNRLKRILREFVRLRIGRFTSGDYLVRVKLKAGKEEEKILLGGFEKLLKGSRLLKE